MSEAIICLETASCATLSVERSIESGHTLMTTQLRDVRRITTRSSMSFDSRWLWLTTNVKFKQNIISMEILIYRRHSRLRRTIWYYLFGSLVWFYVAPHHACMALVGKVRGRRQLRWVFNMKISSFQYIDICYDNKVGKSPSRKRGFMHGKLMSLYCSTKAFRGHKYLPCLEECLAKCFTV